MTRTGREILADLHKVWTPEQIASHALMLADFADHSVALQRQQIAIIRQLFTAYGLVAPLVTKMHTVLQHIVSLRRRHALTSIAWKQIEEAADYPTVEIVDLSEIEAALMIEPISPFEGLDDA